MTSTATLQAATDVVKNKDPSIGYSIAYPFGVIGPILCIYFMTRIVRPKFPAKTQRFHMGEISVGERFAGRRLGDLMAKAPAGLQVTMVRKGGRNIVVTDDTILENGDAILVVAEDTEAIATAAAKLGKLSPGRLASDRADLDYIRVFVGKASAVGIPLASLPMPAGYPTHLLHVRRYDADLVPAPDLMLKFGDRVGVLAPPERKEEIRRHFGDTVKATAEFSYVSLGLGMVMGVLLGLIPIPIPGVGTVTLGIGGGPLIVALILGKLRRTGPMLWTMPLPANIVLRNFGLAMFLASVGVNAGQPFVRTVAESGLTMLFIGVAVLLTTVFIVLLVGHYLMKIPYDDLVGILCNVLVCAAVWLAYGGRTVTDKIVAVVLPVSAFIAAGFEHCVANMYFLPLAWLLVRTGHAPEGFDGLAITAGGILHNLVPVTIGNIVGGSGMVGIAYWAIYRSAFGKERLGGE